MTDPTYVIDKDGDVWGRFGNKYVLIHEMMLKNINPSACYNAFGLKELAEKYGPLFMAKPGAAIPKVFENGKKVFVDVSALGAMSGQIVEFDETRNVYTVSVEVFPDEVKES